MPLTVTLDLPIDMGTKVGAEAFDLNAAAKEGIWVALYRRGALSHKALCEGLDLDRFDAERVLKRHNVIKDLGTLQDYLDDARRLTLFWCVRVCCSCS